MNSRDVAATRVRRPLLWVAVAAVLVIVASGGVWLATMNGHHHQSADAAMAARAQEVMPFDLSRTKHTFMQTPQGGVETVVAIDPADASNRDLIRTHLRAEAAAFRQGNYSDPAKIHGMDMPGVKELKQGAARITVDYAEIPSGAQITYTSAETALVSAIHAWFDRQASDHAMPGMGG